MVFDYFWIPVTFDANTRYFGLVIQVYANANLRGWVKNGVYTLEFGKRA